MCGLDWMYQTKTAHTTYENINQQRLPEYSIYQTGEVHRMEETIDPNPSSATTPTTSIQSIINHYHRDKDNNISVGKYPVRLGYSLYISNQQKKNRRESTV